MNQLLNIGLITGSSAVALVILIRGVRRGQFLGRWNASSVYVLSLAWILLASSVLIQVQGGNVSFVDVFGTTTIVANSKSTQVMQFAGYAIMGLGFITFVRGVVIRSPIYSPLVLAGLLVVITDMSSSFAGASTMGSPRIVALFALFLGASVLPRGAGAKLGIAAVGLSVALVSGFMLPLYYSNAFRVCRADKCGPLGNLYFGLTTGENIIGLIVAAAIPAVFLAFRSSTKWFLASYLLLVVFISGSRTSLQTAILVFGLAFVLAVAKKGQAHKWAVRLTSGVAVAGLAVGIILPHLDLNPTAFTNRAYLWQLANQQLSESPFVGFGALVWGDQVSGGLISRDEAYSVHNQWLDLLYTSGILGAILCVVIAAILLRHTKPGTAHMSALLFIPVVSSGILERTWAFGLLDVFGWMAAATILALEPKPAAQPNHVTHASLNPSEAKIRLLG